MGEISIATERQIAEIYRESFSLWGAGLTEVDYRGLWTDIASTEWAKRNATFLVSLDSSGKILSSLKLYRPAVRVLGHQGRAAILGAIFTPRARRREGHAAALIRSVLEQARANGDLFSLLYSDIGTRYYRDFGFSAIVAEEQWGTLPRQLSPEGEGWELREARVSDLDEIMACHKEFTAGQPLVIDRDPAHWGFLDVRAASYFRRLPDRDIRQRLNVASYKGELVGYVLSVEGRGEWNIREAGARAGDVEAIASVLQLAAVQAKGLGMRRFYGWLPPGVGACLRGWTVRTGPRRRARPMICPLALPESLHDFVHRTDLYLPYQDQF